MSIKGVAASDDDRRSETQRIENLSQQQIEQIAATIRSLADLPASGPAELAVASGFKLEEMTATLDGRSYWFSNETIWYLPHPSGPETDFRVAAALADAVLNGMWVRHSTSDVIRLAEAFLASGVRVP